jgi:hypothetical protein
MNRRALGLLLASGFAQTAMPADLSPGDFAFGMQVVTAADAAAYRVTLPVDVYRDAVRRDLADIRVFNARGEVVPYALRRPPERTVERGPGTALTLFALHGDTPAAADAIRVTIDSPNAAFKLQTQGGNAAAGTVRQYILDGRALDVPVAVLQLTWPDAAAEFTGHVRVEVSDDFAAWRTLAAAAPIANLHANGQQLVKNRIAVPATRAKYWRLSWLGGSAPFELSAVVAEAADSRIEAERSTLEVAGSPAGSAPGDYEFDFGARLPVERINLGLPEVNTVVAVELLSRMRPQDPWRHIARGQFYRVNTADGELRNSPLDIAVDSDRYWLVRAAGASGATAGAPLHLQAAWMPSDVVFLARGTPPFMLTYGSATAPAAETDLSLVPAAVQVQRATLGERRQLGGPARLAAAGEFPWKRTLLWAMLALSVCLLAWMAYRLSKDLGEAK